MCSRHEAMGRVTVEAMSACLPVIGFDNGGTAELIEHERSGCFTPVGLKNSRPA